MKLSHEEYLKQVLESKKNDLKELKIERRIYFAESQMRQEMLTEQIDSIEKQLEQ
ncbi:hypothetical protein [Bhargavaea ginsengi]|uniref:hypothetical protein n=1 Tax=Bhargavaea ginsengi TaxID=426757 RepID=UPI003C767F3E